MFTSLRSRRGHSEMREGAPEFNLAQTELTHAQPGKSSYGREKEEGGAVFGRATNCHSSRGRHRRLLHILNRRKSTVMSFLAPSFARLLPMD
jgi:hypothetical protein